MTGTSWCGRGTRTDDAELQRLAARQREVQAAIHRRDDRLLELQRQFQSHYARWQRLGERVEHYGTKILPLAEQNAEASLQAYQSGVTDFTEVMRARLTELDSRLQSLRLRIDRAQAQSELLYLGGMEP